MGLWEVITGFRFEWGPRKKAACFGLLQWIGEAIIGLIPLIVFEAIHRFSRIPPTAICPDGSLNSATHLFYGCAPVPDSPLQEVCILAVVISGLAVLSVVPIESRPREITLWTRPLILMAVCALIFGSLFYALFSAHIDQNADTLSYVVLVVALISSLSLAVEGAILEA